MRLELAMPEDAEQLTIWCEAKIRAGYNLSPEELRGTLLKVRDQFFIPARKAMFLGPLVPNPVAEGRELTIALHRMVKDIRKTFEGDICYLNYEENGVDQAARRIGNFRELPDVMIVTRHGRARLMVLERASRGGAAQVAG